jgi:hypothetical protein
LYRLGHQIYTASEILDHLFPKAVHLSLLALWKMYLVLYAYLIEYMLKVKMDVDFNSVPKTSDLIQNVGRYDQGKVIHELKNM